MIFGLRFNRTLPFSSDIVRSFTGAHIRRIIPSITATTVLATRLAAVSLARSSPPVRLLLYSTYKEKHRLRRQARALSQRVRRSHPSSNHTPTPSTSLPFLSVTPHDDKKERLRAYISATSSETLMKRSCSVCARLLFVHLFPSAPVPISEIPNRSLLIPSNLDANMSLTDGMLLHSSGLLSQASMASICSECLSALQRNKQPRLSLASGLWVGDVPDSLQCLSLAEQLLVALAFPRAYIVKLFPKDRRTDTSSRQRRLPNNMLFDALSGNVCSVDMPHAELDDMLRGGKLPHPPKILADLLSIAWVGTFRVPPQYLRGSFGISRTRVYRALWWLKRHNPEYHDIQIDPTIWNSLPDIEGELPAEIVIRSDVDQRIVQSEWSARAPAKATDVDISEEGELESDTEEDNIISEDETGEVDEYEANEARRTLDNSNPNAKALGEANDAIPGMCYSLYSRRFHHILTSRFSAKVSLPLFQISLSTLLALLTWIPSRQRAT